MVFPLDVVYGAANTVAVAPWGVRVWVQIGSHWRADDPLVIASPSLFTTDPTVGMSYSIPPTQPQRVYVGPQPDPEPAVTQFEQATAAPGEQRNTTRADAAFTDLIALRERAHQLGIAVDNRWGIGRLTQEIENAGGDVA